MNGAGTPCRTLCSEPERNGAFTVERLRFNCQISVLRSVSRHRGKTQKEGLIVGLMSLWCGLEKYATQIVLSYEVILAKDQNDTAVHYWL